DKIGPPPARRAVALARLLGASRRLSQGPVTLESERPRPLHDVSATKRLTPSLAQVVTQPGPRTAAEPRPEAERLLTAQREHGGTARALRPTAADLVRSSRGSPSTPVVGGPPAPEAPATLRVATMRPFPPRFAGRFQVRGPVLRSVDKVIIDIFGAA